MYADDVLLITNTCEEMNILLKVCEDYGAEYQVTWNPGKTQLMKIVANLKKEKKKINFCGVELEKINKLTYLGTEINNKLTNTDHGELRRTKSTKTAYYLTKVGIKSRYLDYKVRAYLYKVYCRPVMLYGMESTYMKSSDIKKFQTQEGNTVKGLIGIHKRTKTTELLRALKIETIKEKLYEIKLKFFQRLMKNEITTKLYQHVENTSETNKTKKNWRCFNKEIKEIISNIENNNETEQDDDLDHIRNQRDIQNRKFTKEEMLTTVTASLTQLQQQRKCNYEQPEIKKIQELLENRQKGVKDGQKNLLEALKAYTQNAINNTPINISHHNQNNKT